VSVTSLQRSPSVPKLVLTPEEAANYERSNTWNVNERVQTAAVDTNALPPSGEAA
jgi:hypothetical protein